MFGATLAVRTRPDSSHVQPPDEHWLFGCLHWGRANARVVPTLQSYQRVLLPNQPLTPSWSCSPSTLAVTFLLIDAPRCGRGGVSDEYESGFLDEWIPRQITRADLLGSDRPAEQTIQVNLLPENPGSSEVDGVHQPSQSLGDLNVAVLYRHEQTLVRIFPPHRLLDIREENGRPYLGFLSAYNPVTGVDFFSGDADQAEVGELWKFEAAGAMEVAPPRPQRMGASPHHWDRIENNQVRFHKIPPGGLYGPGFHGIWYRETNPTQNQLIRLQTFNHFITFDLNEDTLSASYRPGSAFRPIACGDDRLNLISRVRGNPSDYKNLYTQRAVPFLTLNEFTEATDYPNASALLPSIRSA